MLADIIKSDMNIFFNIDDFGETHNLNGKNVICIIDYNAVNNSAKVDSFAEFSVSKGEITLFAKVEDFTNKISVNGMLILDKKTYIIENFAENMGVYEIGLSQNKN